MNHMDHSGETMALAIQCVIPACVAAAREESRIAMPRRTAERHPNPRVTMLAKKGASIAPRRPLPEGEGIRGGFLTRGSHARGNDRDGRHSNYL
jgi:hypothetical protein